MVERVFPIVSYAVQSRGPVLSGLMLDNGPALMASYLNQAGYRPVVFDFNNVETINEISRHGKEAFLRETIDSLDDYYRSHGVRIVGTKLYTNGFADNVRIHKELKKRNPKLVVAAGGPHVNYFMEDIFNHTDAFDILSFGDGDAAITRIADFFYKNSGDLSEIPGIIYKQNGEIKRKDKQDINLNELVFPLYDEDVYLGIKDKIMIPVVEDSRGCSYSKCLFCIHPRIGGKFRERDIERFVDEIRYNEKEHGFTVTRLSGPSPSSAYINRLVDSLPESHKISAFGSVEEGYDFGRMKDKVLAIFIGLESADKRTLEEVLNKTDNTEGYLSIARKTIAGLKDHSMASVTSMIVPAADETTGSMEKSREFLEETNPDFAPVLPLVPMPDTALTKDILAGRLEGIRIDSDYTERMMVMDIDLLQPQSMWPRVPWQIRVDGKWEENPFMVSQDFSDKIIKKGIYPLSDEIVLMTYLYHNGLDPNQNERRRQCLEFMGTARKYIAGGDARGIRGMVNQINENQLRG